MMILIGDDRVKAIPVIECGEPFVDLMDSFKDLTFDLDRYHVQKKSKSISIGRKLIGEMLVSAQKRLPTGIRFLIKEVYRPLWIQREFFDGYSRYLQQKYPDWSKEKIYTECSKLNAPVDVAPHSTGGAVDLTLIDLSGHELEMGTGFNAELDKTDNATFTSAQNVSEQAKVNRQILMNSMRSVGFVNYPTEWWHWSYGDKYWALITGASASIFGQREDF